MRKCGKNKSQGFTLIELLVVITIIGLLAGVLLITVRNAILKARDARVIAALGQIRTQAEIYFDSQPSPSYININSTDPSNPARAAIIAAANDIEANNGILVWGRVTDNSYAAWSVLPSDRNMAFCIDSTGRAVKRLSAGLNQNSTETCN